MQIFRQFAAYAAPLALAACVAPIGPVEVTRFHAPEAASRLGHGTIAVEAAPGMDPKSLELATYERAVAHELVRLGYDEAAEGTGDQVALVRLKRASFKPGRAGGPVSVGGAAGTGSYGSGVGLGLAIDLSGSSGEQVTTELGVMIKDRASEQTIWEGRASFIVSAKSPLAQTTLGAPKMAEALFQDFPGNDGETVEVK